jgi:FMN reductase
MVGGDVVRGHPLIVGVGGTLRENSTSGRALQLALSHARAMGASTELFTAGAINLPPFDPGDRERTAEAKSLVDALRRADGIILSSPGYHGTVSGLIKNALDYIEDLRGDTRVYLTDRPVGIIVCADGAQAMGSTLATLRSIVHALRGWPTPFAAAVNASAKPFAADGKCTSTEVEQSIRLTTAQAVEFAQMRLAAEQRASHAHAPGAAHTSAELSERMAAMELTFRLMG